jgi:hypothetical protein
MISGSMCRHIEFLVTWIMDLDRISLDVHDLDENDACLGGLHGYYIVGTTHT